MNLFKRSFAVGGGRVATLHHRCHLALVRLLHPTPKRSHGMPHAGQTLPAYQMVCAPTHAQVMPLNSPSTAVCTGKPVYCHLISW